MDNETQESITKWSFETFGELPLPRAIVDRAGDEFNELVAAAYTAPTDGFDWEDEVAEEAADVIIVLSKLFSSIGRDMQTEINKKMAINRARKWLHNEDGSWTHV